LRVGIALTLTCPFGISRLRFLESGEYYTLKGIRRTPLEMSAEATSPPAATTA
jgi:hypothetical protein